MDLIYKEKIQNKYKNQSQIKLYLQSKLLGKDFELIKKFIANQEKIKFIDWYSFYDSIIYNNRHLIPNKEFEKMIFIKKDLKIKIIIINQKNI